MFYSKSTGGFYTPEVNGTKIPNDVVEITIAKHADLLKSQSEGCSIAADENGYPIALQPEPPTKVELKGFALQLINIGCEQAVRTITETYPASEVLSWPKQEQEARAFSAGPAETPLIDALAEARSVDKAYLVEKIIEKSDQFAVISGSLIGKRQKLEDQLNALPSNASSETIAAIKWE